MPAPSDSARERRAVVLVALGLAALAAIAYHNSFATPFVFDDVPAILENRSIRQLAPIGGVLLPDQAGGLTTSGRPLVNLSFALNHALGGYAVRGYHAVNLAIHLAAGLCLFGWMRRTLLTPRLRPRFGEASLGLAAGATALWLLHPLQTESVTYVVQRAESLVGLFYLLTLYAFVRATAGVDSGAGSASRGWSIVAVGACLAGMATKEVMVSAPLVVLLYDRTFCSGTFRAAWARRRGFYLGLAATWILLGWLVARSGSRGGTAGFGTEISSWSYALTQCGAIVRYGAAALWPDSLTFDYGLAMTTRLTSVLPQALLLIATLGFLVRGLRRAAAWSFAGAAFFLVLAPTSSFVPIVTQTMAEHRLYLPLAALAALAAVGGFMALGGRVRAPLALAALALLCSTIARNRDYRSEAAIWADTAAKLPTNARAHNNLGQALFRAEKIDEAIRSYRRALALQPKYPETHYNLAVALARLGRVDEAISHYETALAVQPRYPEAHNNLGNALVRLGRPAEAIRQYEAAIAEDPDFAEAVNNLGNALLAQGQAADAAKRFERALVLKPDYPEARYNLGNAHAAAGRMDAALAQYREALRLKPDYAAAHVNAGNALLTLGRLPEALTEYGQALANDPQLADAHYNQGSVLMQLGRWPEAIPPLEAALRLRPDFPGAHRALGVALFQAGRPTDAIPHYEQHLRANPRDTEARAELDHIRSRLPR